MTFSEIILLWYAENKRPMPWRNTTDPYKIWLSEVILQQTRVSQGLPYYRRFLRHFPTVRHLSEASEHQVLKLWQGLGYYSRARNLHKTARIICEEYGGRFPDTYDTLLNLKGVGDYTASAIASICFGLPEPVVDGNVYRVLARYFGIDHPINTSEGIRYFKSLARELMDPRQIRAYNQAIMEFGAVQCSPKRPLCATCPLRESCEAIRQDRVRALPVKLKKSAISRRYFNYLIPLDESGNTMLNLRTSRDIWQHLYEFPLIESQKEIPPSEVRKRVPALLPHSEVVEVKPLTEQPVVYKLTHQHLHTRFWIVHTKGQFADGVTPDRLEKFPMPVLIADCVKTLKNSYF